MASRPEFDSWLQASSPSEAKMASSPPTNSSSSVLYETHEDLTAPYHPLGDFCLSKDRLQNVQPCEIEILDTPHDNENSAVCIVKVRGITCAMKVHHGQPPEDKLIRDYFLDEPTADRRLKTHGFCETGAIPDFYGIVLGLKPEDWPDWELYYREDCYMLTANTILLENVEGMCRLTIENYTPARMERWAELIKQFHAANVTHGDPFPRNMMFVPAKDGKAERVLWLDFGLGYSSKVDCSDDLYDKKQKLDREEAAVIMDQVVAAMAIDATEHNGEIVETELWWSM